jgi:DNA polymerase I-like protein with 3'-5' exonuclease and polymerase domains
VLSRPEEAITKLERDVKGKRTRHGGHYDMGGGKLAQIAKIPVREASTALKRFHAANPKIKQVFHEGVQQAIKKTGCLISPHGRRHDFMDRINNALFRKAYSLVPQATVADHNKLCMLKIKHELPYVEYLGEFHDGTLAEIPEDKIHEFKREVVKAVETEIPFTEGTFKRPPIIIKAEVTIGKDNWHGMEEI